MTGFLPLRRSCTLGHCRHDTAGCSSSVACVLLSWSSSAPDQYIGGASLQDLPTPSALCDTWQQRQRIFSLTHSSSIFVYTWHLPIWRPDISCFRRQHTHHCLRTVALSNVSEEHLAGPFMSVMFLLRQWFSTYGSGSKIGSRELSDESRMLLKYFS
jgi:hypothetical protein